MRDTTTSAMHTAQQRIQHNRGPSSCDSIEMGFHPNLRRPFGGGKKGELLGSVLPMPAGCTSAFAAGKIWMPIRHCPMGFCRQTRRRERSQKKREASWKEGNVSVKNAGNLAAQRRHARRHR